jgi:hypothetical protein
MLRPNEALDSLQSERLASIDFRDPEASEAEQEWSPTGKGAAAAVEVVGLAGRVIGWPAAPPASPPESGASLPAR